MKKLRITFPNGFVAHAAIREKEEPKCAADCIEFFKTPKKLICHHTISTGNIIICHDLPPAHPVAAGSQVAPLGANPLHYTCIKAGDIIWKGWSITLSYGPSTEPAESGGPLIARIDDADYKAYFEACKDVWFHTYIYHELACVTVEVEEV